MKNIRLCFSAFLLATLLSISLIAESNPCPHDVTNPGGSYAVKNPVTIYHNKKIPCKMGSKDCRCENLRKCFRIVKVLPEVLPLTGIFDAYLADDDTCEACCHFGTSKPAEKRFCDWTPGEITKSLEVLDQLCF